MKISALLLAGGKGLRMQSDCPKQFLMLNGKPVVFHSLEVLLQNKHIHEVIVVCLEQYRFLFADYPVKCVEPGVERQDSVYNGLCAVSPLSDWVLVHDAARPFISAPYLDSLFSAASDCAACALAVPSKNTLKEVNREQKVLSTLDRSKIWEMQTPQLLKKEIMQRGFDYARKNQLLVTDDVSLAELIDIPVQLVLGSYSNFKLTTTEDFLLAQWMIKKS